MYGEIEGIIHSRVYEDQFVNDPYRVTMGMDLGREKYFKDEDMEAASFYIRQLSEEKEEEIVEMI